MNTPSLPPQASVASWPSLNGAVSTQSSATSIILAAAVQGESHDFFTDCQADSRSRIFCSRVKPLKNQKIRSRSHHKGRKGY